MLKKNADKSFEAVEIASPNGDRTQIKGKRSAGRLIMAELEAFGDALLRLFLRVVRIAARPQQPRQDCARSDPASGRPMLQTPVRSVRLGKLQRVSIGPGYRRRSARMRA